MAVAELQGEVLPKIFVTRQMDSSLGSPVLGALRSREEETRDLSCVLNVSSKILCCVVLQSPTPTKRSESAPKCQLNVSR
jgi:hypothetical protein